MPPSASAEPQPAQRGEGGDEGAPAPTPSQRRGLLHRPWRWAVVGALAATGGGAAALVVRDARRPVVMPGVRFLAEPLGDVPLDAVEARVAERVARFLDEPLLLDVAGERVRVRRRDLGFTVDTAALTKAIRAVGHSANLLDDLDARLAARSGPVDVPLDVALDEKRANEALTQIKEALDRAPVDAHLDLERHTIAAEQPGRLVELYASLAELELAARTTPAPSAIALRTVAVPAKVSAAELARIDISTVVGTWETHYSTLAIDSDRTYNLKVGADKLNGHILKPHELFSFNEVVGDRTEKQGYRVAPVISGGELIDGLAGGMCQIASTLHAASFFGGLEIVESTPHSRPSAYIPLGLDSTVVWPSTDLKLRNPFDFPIVMHFSVHQGSVKVELLGKERPYKVVMEREILKESGFGESHRSDPNAPKGQKLLLQEGYPGYVAERRRLIFAKDTPTPKLTVDHALKVEKKTVHYPATEQIVAFGSGGPKLPKKPNPPSHHIPPIPKSDKPLFRLTR